MVTKRTDCVSAAAETLRAGGLCAVPTETVYGLAGNGLDAQAVAKIYAVKHRPAHKPLSLLAPDAQALDRYGVDVPPAAYTLSARFWPGPLTIVVRAAADIPPAALSGGETVGLRCPDHPLTLQLLRELDFPLAAPSANLSDMPSPKTETEVLAALDGKIECILCGGACGVGRESTVVDLSVTPYRILRQGALPESEIFAALRETMTVIGITGGTGGGKTTALRVVEALGGTVIDCDAVYHELLSSSEQLRAALEKSFPAAFTHGFDRKKLGQIVFADEKKLLLLNEITHRHVYMAVDAILTELALQGGTLAAIDAIALIESGLGAQCTAIVGVTAPEEARVQRLMAREGISREYAALRISAQKPDSFFRENCDYILENSGTREAFSDKCSALFQTILMQQKGAYKHEREERTQRRSVLQTEERL